MFAHRTRPVLILHAVGNESQELLAAAALDQPFRQRVPLGIPFVDDVIVANDDECFRAMGCQVALQLVEALRGKPFILGRCGLPFESDGELKT